MKTRFTYIIFIIIAITLVLPFRQGMAHDDGLTCHEHPTEPGLPGVTIYSDLNRNTFIGIEVLQHKFENLAANALEERSAKFKQQHVSTVIRGISEFTEMVEIVSRLVIRAERINDKAEKENAIKVSENLFDNLPINSFMKFDSLLKENRHSISVLVSIDTLIDFLMFKYEVPDSLLIIVRNASQSC